MPKQKRLVWRIKQKNQTASTSTPPKPKQLVWRIKQRNQKASTSTPPPPWVDLPREITSDILRRLGAVDILLNAQRVCSTWWKACHDPTMWRDIDMSNKIDMHLDIVFEKLCRIAVDRSQGQLIKINMESFCSNDLLNYIAQRSSQLRHLRFVICDKISTGGLAAVAKNFPLLEELHIYLFVISTVDIEAVGHSCSQLKSFTLNDNGFRGFTINVNEHALAIAANMPKLQHLALFGNSMTNEGLCAILDGCPQLESLDLRHCYNIDLKGDLGTRCRQQIIDLKCPRDCTQDYEFSTQILDFNSCDEESDLDQSDHFYEYDYDYDDFEYDDFTKPFGSVYLNDSDFFW